MEISAVTAFKFAVDNDIIGKLLRHFHTNGLEFVVMEQILVSADEPGFYLSLKNQRAVDISNLENIIKDYHIENYEKFTTYIVKPEKNAGFLGTFINALEKCNLQYSYQKAHTTESGELVYDFPDSAIADMVCKRFNNK